MDYYTDERGILYDKVKYHTRKKHAFIKGYLDIWVERVKNSPPTLDIFDLYAATGKCYCEDAAKYGLPESTWDGSAILSANCLMNYSNGRDLFLNTYADDPDDCEKQKENLTRLLSEMGFRNTHYLKTEPIEKAVESAITCIRDLRYPTLWILDPHAVSELPWTVVERIAKLKAQYFHNNRWRIRKPELIITLMTEDFQRWYKTSPELISIALGTDEEYWGPAVDELIGTGYNAREAFVLLYMEGLYGLYDKEPIYLEVNITDETAIVYLMILMTESDAGWYVSKLKMIPEFKDWIVKEWRPGARKIIAEKHLPKGQKKLFI